MYPPNDLPDYPTFDSTTPASNRNFANAVTYRQRQMASDLLSPGLPRVNVGPEWDAFWGGMEHSAEDAKRAGMNFKVDYSGLGQGPSSGARRMPTASASLSTRTGVDDGSDPVTAYQLGRAELNRRLEENQGLREANRMQALTDALATDPGMIAAHAKDAAAQAETDAAARDRIAAGEFERTRGLRDAQTREDVSRAREIQPYTPAATTANAKIVAENARLQEQLEAANIRAQAERDRALISGFSSTSNMAQAPTEKLPQGNPAFVASQALRERAFPSAGPAGPSGAGKVFDSRLLSQFEQEHNLTPDQAKRYITSHGYTIR